MFFDLNASPGPDGAIAYPDWPHAAPARQSVREEIVLAASQSANSVRSVPGTADQRE